jgi:hypothetical protein
MDANTKTIFPSRITQRPLYKADPANTSNRFLQVYAGQETICYAVDINMAMLDELARKAAGSKGQKSKDGPISVRIVARKNEGGS